ncbi:hypothetical protein E4K72_04555 [Oxalobacteraceae bacterium OM1]|nr:hypothetical protein E4K72_04555 [Oxalobacteraceae bacterium OM1]
MRTETIGEYEIECAGMRLPETDGWAAFLTVYGPSRNPMHRNPVFPSQRVAVENVFPDEAAAEEEARRVALAMLH